MSYRDRVSVDGWSEEYPGERVDRALDVLAQYARRARLNLAADGPQTVMGDLLADLLHVAAAERLDFNAVLATARRHFEAEHDAGALSSHDPPHSATRA